MADRTGGEDRYATAALVAAQVVAVLRAQGTPPGGVLLASGEDASGGIDALSASFLAGHLSAPLLLTARGSLPAPTAAAKSIAPKTSIRGFGAWLATKTRIPSPRRSPSGP